MPGFPKKSTFSELSPPPTPTKSRLQPPTPAQRVIPGHEHIFQTPPTFQILKKIGEGSYSTVFLAVKNAKKCAIKILKKPIFSETDKNRKTKEIEILHQICSKNVVALLDAWTQNGILYTQMEFCSSLILLIENVYVIKKQILTKKQVYKIICDVAKGLFAIHECGFVHLDVKPSNILFTNVKKEKQVSDWDVKKISDWDVKKEKELSDWDVKKISDRDEKKEKQVSDQNVKKEKFDDLTKNRKIDFFNDYENKINCRKIYDCRQIYDCQSKTFSDQNKTFNDQSKTFNDCENKTDNQNNSFDKKNNSFDKKNNSFDNQNNSFDNQNFSFDNQNNSFDKKDESLQNEDIFVDEDDFLTNLTFKICDLNISQKQGKVEQDGDKRYMAPETLQGFCSFKSDIYSLGLIFLELRSGIVLPDSGEDWLKLRENRFDDVCLENDEKLFLFGMIDCDWKKRVEIGEVIEYFESVFVG